MFFSITKISLWESCSRWESSPKWRKPGIVWFGYTQVIIFGVILDVISAKWRYDSPKQNGWCEVILRNSNSDFTQELFSAHILGPRVSTIRKISNSFIPQTTLTVSEKSRWHSPYILVKKNSNLPVESFWCAIYYDLTQLPTSIGNLRPPKCSPQWDAGKSERHPLRSLLVALTCVDQGPHIAESPQSINRAYKICQKWVVWVYAKILFGIFQNLF